MRKNKINIESAFEIFINLMILIFCIGNISIFIFFVFTCDFSKNIFWKIILLIGALYGEYIIILALKEAVYEILKICRK